MTAAASRPGWLRRPENLHRLARGVLVLVFLWLAGRYWHPYYGFTAFLQFDDSAAAVMLPELRDTPVYVHHNTGGYDGLYYAQMAVHPALRDPAMAPRDGQPAISRAAHPALLAGVCGRGARRPVARACRLYAAMNVVLWLGTWRRCFGKNIPRARRRAAQPGGVGRADVFRGRAAQRAVRPDRPARRAARGWWLRGGLARGTRRRGRLPRRLIGAAGLVREDRGARGAISLWPADWRKISGATLARCVLAVLPLALWLALSLLDEILSGP